MSAKINWAAWVGVGVSVAIVAGGGAVSCGILQADQKATRAEVIALRDDLRRHEDKHDEKDQKLDERLRKVELAEAEGRRK